MWQTGFKQATPNQTATVGTTVLPQTVVGWAANLSCQHLSGAPLAVVIPLGDAPLALVIQTTLLFLFLWTTAQSYPKKPPPSHKVKAAPIEKLLGIVLFFLCARAEAIHSESHSEISHNQHTTSANVKDKQSQLLYLQLAEQGKQTEP